MKKLIHTLKIVGMVALASGLVVTSLYVGNKYGERNKTAEFHKTLIDKGFAQYNPTTGEWQYKNVSDMLPNLEDKQITLMSMDVEGPLPVKNEKKIAKNK